MLTLLTNKLIGLKSYDLICKLNHKSLIKRIHKQNNNGRG